MLPVTLSYYLEELLRGTALDGWADYAGVTAIAVLLLLIRSLFFSSSKIDISGKVALITGGGRGIGLLMAKKLALEHRCKVVLWDLNQADLNLAQAQLVTAGAPPENVMVARVDVTDRHAVYAATKHIASVHGHVQILVNNAGIVTGKKFMDCPDELMEKTVQVNTISHFWTLKACLPHMIESNSGHVVTIASIAGHCGVAGLIDYCASKFGAVGIDSALRFELYSVAPGIKTLCVCPYYIQTGMFAGITECRFPWLIPTLQPQYVADKVVQSIIAGDAVLFMPRFLNLVPLLRGLFTVRQQDRVADFLGFSKSMDTFVGHSAAK